MHFVHFNQHKTALWILQIFLTCKYISCHCLCKEFFQYKLFVYCTKVEASFSGLMIIRFCRASLCSFVRFQVYTILFLRKSTRSVISGLVYVSMSPVLMTSYNGSTYVGKVCINKNNFYEINISKNLIRNSPLQHMALPLSITEVKNLCSLLKQRKWNEPEKNNSSVDWHSLTFLLNNDHPWSTS